MNLNFLLLIKLFFINLLFCNTIIMKKLLNVLLLAGLTTYTSFSQYSTIISNPSFRYVATPGFVNISELNGGIGSCNCDPSVSTYYYGVTNLFGYQVSRNFQIGRAHV